VSRTVSNGLVAAFTRQDMANYSYTKKTTSAASWIECLRLVSPASSASSSYSEIHFTEPKAATTAAMQAPHVTFIRGSIKTHWYLKAVSGKWSAQLGGSNTTQALTGEGAIAQNVVDDAVQLNYIAAPAPSVLVSDDGFTTPETRGGRRARVKKSWQSP
jgi:hypothetical protein